MSEGEVKWTDVGIKMQTFLYGLCGVISGNEEAQGYGHLTTNNLNKLHLYMLYIFVYNIIFDGNLLPGKACDSEQNLFPPNTQVMQFPMGMTQ